MNAYVSSLEQRDSGKAAAAIDSVANAGALVGYLIIRWVRDGGAVWTTVWGLHVALASAAALLAGTFTDALS